MAAYLGTFVSGATNVALTLLQRNVNAKKSTVFVPEGLVNLVQLGLLSQVQLYPVGTLVGFIDHSVVYFSPHLLQGTFRSIYDQSHEDLALLEDHLKLIMRRVWVASNAEEQKNQIRVIARFAIRGLQALGKSYEEHYKNDERTLGLVKKYIQKGVLAIDTALQSELKAGTEPQGLDFEMRKNYARSLSYVAETVENLSLPDNSSELNISYVDELNKWANTKILQFDVIKTRVLKNGNLQS